MERSIVHRILINHKTISNGTTNSLYAAVAHHDKQNLYFTEEESLKPQEDATKKGEVKESDQLKHRGATSQLQGEGNNWNEPPKVDETGAKTSGSNSVLEGKEEITTPEKNRKIIRKTYI